jgi:hypothetical protein
VGTARPTPRPFKTRELHLGPEPHTAAAHLWLSPEYRLVADAPGTDEFVYDGAGHALVLPRAVPPAERVPLIIVGRGKTLRLRNVRVANAGALAGCLSIAAGGRLVAESEEGVEMDEGDFDLDEASSMFWADGGGGGGDADRGRWASVVLKDLADLMGSGGC